MATITRVNSSRAASGTSYTLNFTEGTALPAGYVLIAVVNVSNATALSAPSGWTAITGGGNDGANQTRAYVRDSNGSVNGIAWASGFPNSDRTGYIIATPGTYSAQNGAGAGVASGTSISFSSISVSMSPGIIIRSAGLASAPTNWTSGWSGSTSVMTPPASARLTVSQADYTGDPTTATTVTWTGARTSYAFEFVVSIGTYTPPVPTGYSVTGGSKKFTINPGTSAGSNFLRARRRRTGVTAPGTQTQTSPQWPLGVIGDGVPTGNYAFTWDGDGIPIFFCDTGIRQTHAEFTGRVGGGQSFISGEAWDVDSKNHGTQVASMALGDTYGSAKGAELWGAKVLSASAMPGDPMDWDDWDDVVTWVIAQAAGRGGVVNMSLGTPPNTEPANQALFEAGVDALEAEGITVVCAAGNDNIDITSLMGSVYDKVIMVGGTESDNSFWITTPGSDGSNYYTSSTMLVAPSAVLLGAANGSDSATQTSSGTSFGAPLVSGIVAKIKQANPRMSTARIKEILFSQGWDVVTGEPGGVSSLLSNSNAQSTDWFLRTGLSTGSQDDTGYGDGQTYEYQFSASADGVNWSAWSSSTSATTAGIAYTGTASIAGTAGVSPGGVVDNTTGSTIGGTASVSASGVVANTVGSSIAGTAAVTADGSVTQGTASAAIAGTASVTATGIVDNTTGATLSGTASVQADGQVTSPTGTQISGVAAVQASGSLGLFSSAAITGVGSIMASDAVAPPTEVWMSNNDLERIYLLDESTDPDEDEMSNSDLKEEVYGQQTPDDGDPALGLSASDEEIARLRAASSNPNKYSMSLADLRREYWESA